MSLHMTAKMARLTVLGCGHGNNAVESGDGYTAEGLLLEDVAETLGYDYGDDVDWDQIVDNDLDDFDWSQVIYTDDDGTIYADDDGDGVWTDDNGNEYGGGGTMWLPTDSLVDMSDLLDDLAEGDSILSQYSIPDSELKSLYGGKASSEATVVDTGSDRPHSYSPAIWYIQRTSMMACIFLDAPFTHYRANSETVEVYDEAITIRDGSVKAVYWSDCTTRFTDKLLASPYNTYPIQYVCWQCLYGSLSDALISANADTITSADILNGSSDLPSMNYGGGVYYALNGSGYGGQSSGGGGGRR